MERVRKTDLYCKGRVAPFEQIPSLFTNPGKCKIFWLSDPGPHNNKLLNRWIEHERFGGFVPGGRR